MHLLIIHHEAEYFAGAEKVLGYFLDGLRATRHRVTVAAVEQSRTRSVIPAGMKTCWLPPNARFSPMQSMRQLRAITQYHRADPFDLVHGWAARDWELTALSGRLARRPAIGTLHDHPRAPFISSARQRMMTWSARAGLQRVVCVSEALQQACLGAGYQQPKLRVVRNGLPSLGATRPDRAPGKPVRFGFLGQLTERKGVRGLFEIMDRLSELTERPWELAVAGEAQHEEGRKLVTDVQARFSAKTWWRQVEWVGWVKRPSEFLASIDLLICPSSDFDPFPTVVLEAGQAGVALLGARVGGIPEMIEPGRTGWLFDAHDWAGAARHLQAVLETPDLAARAGAEAKKRVEREFTIGRMVEDYLNVYMELFVI
jgi:glycosyltransferase involved in cell wall biosynthesis